MLTLTLLASVALAHEAPNHEHAPDDGSAITGEVRLGRGDHTYQSVPYWCDLPPNAESIGATHGGIATDNAGRIYFTTNQPGRAILVYSPEGEFLKAIADDFVACHSIIHREEAGEEYLYVAHLGGKRAAKLRLDGTPVWTLGFDKVKQSGKYESEKQFKPTAVAVGPDGDIYIADGYGENWIHQFNKDLNYIRSFGGRGEEPGQFKTCHGLALDTRTGVPLLLVADRENRRLQHFDLEGNFIAVITEGLRRPCSMSIRGDSVAIAELQGRVTVIDGTNQPVAYLGDNPNEKQWANFKVDPTDWKVGVFTAPHGVCFDRNGNLYVMDWNASGRISKLDRIHAAE